ncbi:hypothetical protein LZC95_48625 [Pendulispora brunnea]|uniref:Uncharacterized protein n=1 Tax=Pendulispora brunnea TaxID=2905690 RepID=A0ABZ2KBP4_9BACT
MSILLLDVTIGRRIPSNAMMQRFVFPVATILLCGGCSSSGGGTGGGCASLFGGSHTFSDVDLTIEAVKMRDRPMVITTRLSTDSNSNCFVAPDDMRISVDGQALELGHKGGKAPPTMISGAPIQLTECAPAVFRSRMNSIFEDRAESIVVVESHGRRAEARIRHLLAQRQLEIQPSNQLRVGDRVTLVWTSTEDEWSGYSKAIGVTVYHPNDFLVRLQPEIDPPRFTFVLPDVRPGPAKIELATTYIKAPPKVVACMGLKSCNAGADSGPAEVEVTVAPR